MPTHKISSKSKLVLWALMGGTALTLPAPSFAQSADTEVEQGEILVTARRKEERLQDVPVAVTALTGAALESYNVTSVGDIATFVPSMVVGRQVTGSSASIFLRGVGSSSLTRTDSSVTAWPASSTPASQRKV